MARSGFKTYVAIVRPFNEEGGDFDILGVFSNHAKAEEAILNYYRSLSREWKALLNIWPENDLVATIRYRDGLEESYKGSVLKFFVK